MRRTRKSSVMPVVCSVFTASVTVSRRRATVPNTAPANQPAARTSFSCATSPSLENFANSSAKRTHEFGLISIVSDCRIGALMAFKKHQSFESTRSQVRASASLSKACGVQGQSDGDHWGGLPGRPLRWSPALHKPDGRSPHCVPRIPDLVRAQSDPEVAVGH